MTLHTLKTWPEYFAAVASGEKTFELRKDDRGFAVGDRLQLREWDPDNRRYTGCFVNVKVTYVLRPGESILAAEAIAPGFCIMGISLR